MWIVFIIICAIYIIDLFRDLILCQIFILCMYVLFYFIWQIIIVKLIVFKSFFHTSAPNRRSRPLPWFGPWWTCFQIRLCSRWICCCWSMSSTSTRISTCRIGCFARPPYSLYFFQAIWLRCDLNEPHHLYNRSYHWDYAPTLTCCDHAWCRACLSASVATFAIASVRRVAPTPHEANLSSA